MLSEVCIQGISNASIALQEIEYNEQLYQKCSIAIVLKDNPHLSFPKDLTELDIKLGLIGPEARKDKFVYASACVTPEAIKTDLYALDCIPDFFKDNITKKYLHPVPGIYIVSSSQQEHAEWRYLPTCTPSFPYTVLTCLSKCYFGFLPHDENFRNEFKTLLKTDNRKLQTNSRHEFKNAPVENRILLQPGNVVITHAAMPFYVVSENGPPVACLKVSSFEYIKHFDTRVKLWKEAIQNGGWKTNCFSETVYYYLVKKNAENPLLQLRFQRDALNFDKLFLKSNFEKWVVTDSEKKKKKKKNKILEMDPELKLIFKLPQDERVKKLAEYNERKHGVKSAAAAAEDIVTPKKTKPQQQQQKRKEEDEEEEEEEVPAAPQKKKKEAGADRAALIESLLYEYRKMLTVEIPKFDPRIWNPKDLDKINEALEGATKPTDWNAKEFAAFKSKLATLRGRVDEAKVDNETKIPVWNENLIKIKTLLDQTDALLGETGKNRNFWKNHEGRYKELMMNKNVYWNAATVKDMDIALTKLELMNTQLSAPIAFSSAAATASSGDFVVPKVEQIYLKPLMTKSRENGKDGVIDIRMACGKEKPVYAQMISSHKENAELSTVFDKFCSAYDRLMGEIRVENGNGNSSKPDFDVTELMAYFKILREAHAFYKQRAIDAAIAAGGDKPVAAPIKRGGCKACEEKNSRALFPDNTSKYCAQHFIELVVKEDFDAFEGRILKLMNSDEDAGDEEDAALEAQRAEFDDKSEEIHALIDVLTEPGAKVTHDRYKELAALINNAKQIFTKEQLEGLSNEEEDEFVGSDDEEEDGFNIISSKNLPSEEDEAKFTGEEEDDVPKGGGDDSVAHDILVLFNRVPVKSIQDKLVAWYVLGESKRTLLKEMIKDLKNLKKIFGIEIHDKEKDRTYMHDRFYETLEEAETNALLMEKGRLATKVIVKEI
jgi:hypothetical protein